jgi:tetratricopeptide (TPR) repeat protein
MQLEKQLNQLNANTESIEEKLHDVKKNLIDPPWYSGSIGYGIALAIGIISTLTSVAVADIYRRLRVTKAYNQVAKDYADNSQFEQAIRASEQALLVDPMNKKARIQIVRSSIMQEEKLASAWEGIAHSQQMRDAIQRAQLEIGMLKEYHRKDFRPHMYEGDLCYLMEERMGNIKIKQELLQTALDAYSKAVATYCGSHRRFPTEISVRLLKRKHSDLNNLYGRLGELEMDIGEFAASKTHLKTALRYDPSDEDTKRLFEKSLAKEKDLNK